MSLKMKKKFLTAVSINLTDENRAQEFYAYCIASKLNNIALKFLIYTSESFKLHVIEKNVESIRLKGVKYLRFFIGNSFTLAERYLKTLYEYYRNKELPKLRYLYSVSDVNFLNLFENCAHLSINYELDLFGLRLSKHIMAKHKDRVLNNPRFYTYFLKDHVIAQHSGKEDAEIYLKSFMSDYGCSHFFWEDRIWQAKYIIDVVPHEERFEFLKRIFHETYPYEMFETSEEFHTYGVYTLFTPDQLETWALNNFASEQQILKEGDEYIWYKYVKFETAFEGIKKLLMKTTDSEKRALTIQILLDLAKTHTQLKQVLEYYNEIIVKEPITYHECFVFKITNSSDYSVYDFDEDNWSLFSKLCKSDKQCNVAGFHCNCSYYHEMIELIYNIINDIDIPRDTRQLTYSLFFSSIRSFSESLSKERKEKVYQYLVQYYVDEIQKLETEECYDTIKKECRQFINRILEIMKLYEKTKSDCPDIVMKYVNLDWDWFSDEKIFEVKPKELTEKDSTEKDLTEKELTEKDLIHFLKQNPELVVDQLPLVKENIEYDFRFKLNRFLKKLRTYFSHDIARNYLDLYFEMLSEPKLILAYAQAAVYGIFLLADDNFCTEFMLKHVPTNYKINRKLIIQNQYHVEQAVCRNACYSRSSTVQSNIINYIKGDYVLYCTPILNAYLTHLPELLATNFIKNVWEAPLSDPKHTLRLALQWYSITNLNKLAINIWNATKDVSIRCFLYKNIFKRIQDEDESAQIELFETLKIFTQGLRSDDMGEIFELLVSNSIPIDFLPEYLVEGWVTLTKLNDCKKYRTCLIQSLDSHIDIIPQDFCRSIVNAHIQCMIVEEQIRMIPKNEEQDDDEINLINAKWELTANYILFIRNPEELNEKLDLMKLIMNKILQMWNDKQNDKYVIREFFLNYIENTLETKSYKHDVKCFRYINNIFSLLLDGLLNALPLGKIYSIMWKLRMIILTRDVLTNTRLNLLEESSDENKIAILKQASADIATKLGHLVKELVEKEIYFSYMQRDIWIAVVVKLMTVHDYNIDYYDAYEFGYDDVKVLVALDLIKFETRETYMIAAMILEYTYWNGQCRDEYYEVVNKLKSLEDKDLKTYIYEKFA